ncbi:MAG: sigma-70 family RNA polymerase sigma factor, partial [Bacteroidia bacterium]|nr:sigma-70 family RNA polymerase sigma factor [Bacteroidia bacterium]
NLGLIKAAKRFDETRGFKFISYAVWWIRQSVLQALAEQARIVRLPLNQVGSLSKVNKMSSRLEQVYERPPSADEIAKEMDIPEHKVRESMKLGSRTLSMDAPLDQDEEMKFLDVFVPNDSPGTDEILLRESLAHEIQRSLATLTEKEREIINMFYGIGYPHSYTLEEIGAMFDLTRERVRQIKEKAIRRLKHSSRSKLLKSYLG